MDLRALSAEMEQAFSDWRRVCGEMLQRYSANPYTRSRPKDFAWLVAWIRAKQPDLAGSYDEAERRFDGAIARFHAATRDGEARVYPRESYQRLCKIIEMRHAEDAIKRQRLLEPSRFSVEPGPAPAAPARRRRPAPQPISRPEAETGGLPEAPEGGSGEPIVQRQY